MKIIAFNGSPRKNGNTNFLLETVLKEVEKEGIETEIIHVGAKQLQGCLGCMKCGENQDGQCVMKNDELNTWLSKMCQADGIIIGTPVYCADLSAQVKAFIDRASLVACLNGDLLKRKVGAAVVAVRRAGGIQAFHSVNSFFTISQMVVMGSTYWNLGFGMNQGEAEQDAEGVQTMQNLGKNMAWLVKSLAEAKGKVAEPKTEKIVLTNMVR